MPAPTEAKADTFVAHIADHEVEAVNAMSNINGEAGQADLTQAARQAEEREIKMGVMEAFRRYPKATMFSMIYSTCVCTFCQRTCLLMPSDSQRTSHGRLRHVHD